MSVPKLEAMKEPLLGLHDDAPQDNDKPMLDDEMIPMLRLYSSIIGFIVGCLVQFATLGVNFFLSRLVEPESDDAFDTYQVWCFVWAVLAASMATMIVWLQYNLMTYTLSSQLGCYSPQQVRENVGYLAVMYVLGDMVGVYSTFAATQATLGTFPPLRCLISWFVVVGWTGIVYRFMERNRVESAKKYALESKQEDFVKTMVMIV